MYDLTLSPSERGALDWVGYRYWNGEEFYGLLFFESFVTPIKLGGWEGSLTFHVPESVAWKIKERVELEVSPVRHKL